MRLASAAALSVSLHGAVAAAVWLAIDGHHAPATPPVAPIPVELVVASPTPARTQPDALPSPSQEAVEAPPPPPPAAAAPESPPASPPPEPATPLLAPPPAQAEPRVEAVPPRPAARRPDRPAPAPAATAPPAAAPPPAPAPPSEPAAAAAATKGAGPAPEARGPQTAALPATPVRAGAGGPGNPAPAYPEESRTRGEEGRVVLHVLVAADGRPTEVTVKSSSRYRRLDDAARAAVRRWRFEPATVGGVAVDGSLDVPIVFRLE
ncbi:MAG: energy transducer TonB [Rhodospirillales bacterium]